MTDNKSDIYLKTTIANFLKEITPKSIEDISNENFKEEINTLKKISPHAIITTNYDQFLENIFSDYAPIVGQEILKTNYASIGEIYKIHGCVTKQDTLVLNSKDYEEFKLKKKYLSAKLLTFFIEHPLIFIGYRAEDPNIKDILSDIDELISSKDEIIPNIYFLSWDEKINNHSYPPREKILSIENNKNIRIKNITTDSFKWVFDAFSVKREISSINPKILRSLLARTYDLVRHDIPNPQINIDYSTLEGAVENRDSFVKLFGITLLNNFSDINKTFPFILKTVSEKLGHKNWHNAQKLLEKINLEKGVNIKQSDNKYHVAVKTGNNNVIHKYSQEFITLLKKVQENEDYDVDLL